MVFGLSTSPPEQQTQKVLPMTFSWPATRVSICLSHSKRSIEIPAADHTSETSSRAIGGQGFNTGSSCGHCCPDYSHCGHSDLLGQEHSVYTELGTQ